MMYIIFLLLIVIGIAIIINSVMKDGINKKGAIILISSITLVPVVIYLIVVFIFMLLWNPIPYTSDDVGSTYYYTDNSYITLDDVYTQSDNDSYQVICEITLFFKDYNFVYDDFKLKDTINNYINLDLSVYSELNTIDIFDNYTFTEEITVYLPFTIDTIEDYEYQFVVLFDNIDENVYDWYYYIPESYILTDENSLT